MVMTLVVLLVLNVLTTWLCWTRGNMFWAGVNVTCAVFNALGLVVQVLS